MKLQTLSARSKAAFLINSACWTFEVTKLSFMKYGTVFMVKIVFLKWAWKHLGILKIQFVREHRQVFPWVMDFLIVFLCWHILKSGLMRNRLRAESLSLLLRFGPNEKCIKRIHCLFAWRNFSPRKLHDSANFLKIITVRSAATMHYPAAEDQYAT